MHIINRGMVLGVSFAFLLVVAGCSDPFADRIEVTGVVKLKGQPLKSGTIEFSGEKPENSAQAPISNGEYKVLKQSGLRAGNYTVRINATEGTPAPMEAAGPGPGPGPSGTASNVSKNLIPADWNANSKKQVKVTAEGPNKFDFEIP